MADTLEALARRIDTTHSLQSIVRTMKALSAASIAQYDRAVAGMSQYMRTVELGMMAVLRRDDMRPYVKSAGGPVMAILFGSGHGLCGGFNELIVRAARAEQREPRALPDWRWLAVGARAAHSLESAGQAVGDCIDLPGTAGGLIETSHRILLTVDDWRARYGISRVVLFHNRRREETVTPHRIELLPLDPVWLERLAQRPWPSRTIPMFTMEAADLFAALSREYLFANVFRSGAESLASEHAARLAAMQAALRNIEEHLDEMTGDYRRKRQDAITSELLDIVAGYEILRDKH